MNRIREKQHSLLLNRDTRFLNQLNIFDNSSFQAQPQSSLTESTIDIDDDNTCIVWLTNDTSSDVQLFDTIPIKIFYSKEDCLIFISELQTTNVFLIIDYAFVSNLLSIFDNFAQIVFIYVLSIEENSVSPIVTNAKRSIRQLSNNKDELFQLIIKDVDTCIKDSICKNLMDLTEIEESTNPVKNKSFNWYHELIECLSNLNFNDTNAKTDLIDYCRQQYSIDDIVKQNQITQIQNEYSSGNAIQWCIRHSFLFHLLNKALRTRDISQIFQFRYFITDLQEQLEFHCNQNNNIRQYETVYRGQQITQIELMKLKKCIGKYISTNTYLLTSIDEQIALMFAGQGEGDILSIIFEIDIQNARNIHDKRRVPLSVEHLSQFPCEREVIFPISSIFFVTSIELIDKRWRMRLKLTDDNEYRQLIDSLQDDRTEQMPLNIQFVQLYILANGLDKSEYYVKSLIEDLKLLSDYQNIAYICNIMGQAYLNQGYYQQALTYFEKVLDNIPLEHNFLAKIYENIANVYIKKCEYDIARKYLDQALEYKEHLNPIELASLYETFSIMYREMADLDNAFKSINQSLETHRKNLSSSVHLITTIISLALIYTQQSNHQNALRYYKDALNIALKYVPKDDSNLIMLYAMIGFSYLKSKDLLLALTYLEKSLNLIREDVDPIISIFIYHSLAEFYYINDAIEETRNYARRAFDIYNQNQNLIPDRYGLVIQVHFIWARVNFNLFNYNLALNLFLKALKLTEDTRDRILIYYEMGKIYSEKCHTTIALRYFHHSLRLIFQAGQSYLHKNQISLNYYEICKVYQHDNNSEKASFYLKLALRLQLVSKDHNFNSTIFSYYDDLMRLCPQQMKMYIEQLQDISSRSTLSTDVKRLCQEILGNHYKEQENFVQALIHYELCLKYISMSIPISYQNLIDTYQKIGDLHREINKDNPDNALLYYEKAHEIYLKLSDMEELPTRDKYPMFREEKYFLKNLDQSSSLDLRMSNIYFSLFECYIHKKDFKQAFSYLQTYEKKIDEYSGKNPAIIPHIRYLRIGYIYIIFKCYDKAIDCFEKTLQHIRGDYNEYGYTYYMIAQCYENKNNHKMALSKYKISVTFLHNSQVIYWGDLNKCYRSIAFIYRTHNNYEYAFKYFEQALLFELKSDPIDFNQYILTRLEYVSTLMEFKPWDFYEQLNYVCQRH